MVAVSTDFNSIFLLPVITRVERFPWPARISPHDLGNQRESRAAAAAGFGTGNALGEWQAAARAGPSEERGGHAL